MPEQMSMYSIYNADKVERYKKQIRVDQEIENYYMKNLTDDNFFWTYKGLKNKFGKRYLDYLKQIQEDIEKLVPIDDTYQGHKYSRIRTWRANPTIAYANTLAHPIYAVSAIPDKFYENIGGKER